jgi:hypothetical protein
MMRELGDDPAAGTAAAAVDGAAEHDAEHRSDGGMWTARASLSAKLTANDLADEVARQRAEIFVGRATRSDACQGLPAPKAFQIEFNGFEWLCAHDVVAAVSCQQHPVVTVEAVGFEGLIEGVEQPQVRDAGAGVDGELFGAVEAARGWGEDFAHPVGGQREKALARGRWQSLSPPTRDVGHDDVFDEMELGLVQDPPAAGATVTKLHAGEQYGAEGGGADGVGHGWSRTNVQLALHEFAHQVLGQRDEVVVGRGSPSGQRHAWKVARRSGVSISTYRPRMARLEPGRGMDLAGRALVHE